jgi:anti-sigma regulatory factor (Ser/Thr protein kinase)
VIDGAGEGPSDASIILSHHRRAVYESHNPGIGRRIVIPPAEPVLRLPAHVDSVRAARRALDRVASLRHHPQELFHARLLVTELVANSIRHAGLADADVIDLDVSMQSDRLRVEVTDHGPGFDPPHLVEPPSGTSGRGLFLVDALADVWGVARNDAATTVWFEIILV